jgi:hypothetical protein
MQEAVKLFEPLVFYPACDKIFNNDGNYAYHLGKNCLQAVFTVRHPVESRK